MNNWEEFFSNMVFLEIAYTAVQTESDLADVTIHWCDFEFHLCISVAYFTQLVMSQY